MKSGLLIGILLCGSLAFSQNQYIQFHQNGSVEAFALVDEDSIYFDANQTTLFFSNNGTIHNYLSADIDSITFLNDLSKNIYISYNGSSATIVNPMAATGVQITTNGGEVTVTSTSTEKNINYILSGTSSNGFLKVYSVEKYNVLLDGISLTNPTGPALNFQSNKDATVHLINGTNSMVSDGLNYAAAAIVNNVTEDQKGTIFSEGKIEMIGGGSLSVIGLGSIQHALASDEEIEIKEGVIAILSAVKDGVHGSEGFYMNGGQLTINSSGDGIDGEEGVVEINCGSINVSNTVADKKAIAADSTMTINGGSIHITLSGDQSKGLKAGQLFTINGGEIIASSTGNTVLTASGSGYDPSYSSLIVAEQDLIINGGELTLSTTGKGARSIKVAGNLTINDGNISSTASGNGATYSNSTGTASAYHSANFTVDGNLIINDGTITCTESGTGGKGLMIDGTATIGTSTTNPTVSLTTTGSAITISGNGNSGVYDKPKAFKADGAVLIINGEISIHSADDGIKSISSVTINGGILDISNSKEGIESPFITVNGGDISITASDDGFNATNGTVSGGTESNDGSLLKITNGYCVISSTGGDAMDSNGGVQVTGGSVIVHGPQSAPELGLDYNGTGTVSGGFVVVSGPSQMMLQGFGTSSTQKSFILKTSTTNAANTLFHVEDASGNELFTFKPIRNYQTIVFSSPAIVNGSYKIYTSGSHTGTVTDGLYAGGTYSSGTLETSFTVSGTVTTVTF